MKRSRRILMFLVSSSLVLGYLQGCATEVVQAQPPAAAAPLPASVPQQPTEDLEQLVAPIALYPDALVAQVLAAATSPTQIVEADRWLQQHPELKGDALAKEVDAQSWDPSVKALAQFPGLLGMMDKNLSWTSSLGEAYVNGQQNVLDAIQVMRQRAQQAGNLKSTAQESVTTQGNVIDIEPADPQIVYVPEYDPWVVYGDPLAFYPGWIGVPGFYFDGPGIGFGVGIGIGFFGGFGWGWHHWGTDWHGHHLIHGDHPYVPHSREFGNHNGFGRGGFDRGRAGFDHHAALGGSFHGGSSFGAGATWATHGSGVSGMHSGAFSGFNHGSDARTFSSRGRA
ncbi:MAG TPA: DUF3300 domain-containing protein, partial [Steroidobacteraceae bacterium]|nr:DUF3300 domain-containing protein [Steroidobacteraceae bacterium]